MWRSGQVFEYYLQMGNVTTTVTTLETSSSHQNVNIEEKRLIGVGNVGKEANKAIYTLYNPNNNQITFKTVYY